MGQSRCSVAAQAGRTTLSTKEMRRSCEGLVPVNIASWMMIAGSSRASSLQIGVLADLPALLGSAEGLERDGHLGRHQAGHDGLAQLGVAVQRPEQRGEHLDGQVLADARPWRRPGR